MSLSDRLHDLDNRILGRPLTPAQADARMRQRRLKPSRTLALIAAIAPVVLILRAVELIEIAWWRPVVMLVATWLCGIAAWRLHRRGL